MKDPCVINKPQDVINYIQSSIKFEEIKLAEFRSLIEKPQLEKSDLIESFQYLSGFTLTCSNNKTIQLCYIDETVSKYKMGSFTPNEIYTHYKTILKAADIDLNGAIFHSDTELHCIDTLFLKNTNFNPNKQVSFNNRILTKDEIEAINGNIFNQCLAEAIITITTDEIDIVAQVEEISSSDLRQTVKDSLEGAIESIGELRGYEAKYVHEFAKCVHPEPDKVLNISCAGIDDYAFVEYEINL